MSLADAVVHARLAAGAATSTTCRSSRALTVCASFTLSIVLFYASRPLAQSWSVATVRRKLRSIAKQEAPGLTGNGPDLYATQPDSWVEWAAVLFNVIQHTQVAPRGWHVDLVHYVHKGGTNGSLSNHRPLALVEVLRKVFTGTVVDRMWHD